VSRTRTLTAGLALGLTLLLPHGAGAQKRYVAFGDSITFGVGDEKSPNGVNGPGGYPMRLEPLLNSRGVTATVANAGLPGEDTAGALSRVNSILQKGGDVFLLMEGTNDINAKVSTETIVFNLNQLATRAEAKGMQVVHATVVPRLPSANYDSNNHITEDLAAKIRELAFSKQRKLADNFEVFFNETPDFTRLYEGGIDKLHPNAAGYDLLAHVFADVLTNVDSVAPVTGLVDPFDDEQRVPNTAPIRVDLYDFGAGLDLANTKLLINGQPVDTPLAGSPQKVEIRYAPPQPWTGVVAYGLQTRDLANPPHTWSRTLSTFVVAGATFLRGDIDRNGRVDGVDLLAFAPRFGARTPDPRYRAFADLNGDGVIDGTDLAILAANFGKNSF
jgi:lysophospholipase L1-like esterase